MSDVGSQVIQFFTSKGYSKAAAAGIVGNMKQESSLNVNEPGGGLIQGQGGRTSSGSLNQQLNGVLHELNTGYRGVASALKSAKTPEEAARIFSENFEKPGIPELQNREAYAREAFGGKGLAGSATALPQSRSTGVGSLGKTALPTAPVESFDKAGYEKASSDYTVGKLFAGERDNPLLTIGGLRTSEPSKAEFTTLSAPTQAGGLGPTGASAVPREANLPNPPANVNLKPVKPPVQIQLPKEDQVIDRAKGAMERQDKHPVSIKELEKAVGYHESKPPIQTPAGAVHATPKGPVYVPASPFRKLTGQKEAAPPLPARKRP